MAAAQSHSVEVPPSGVAHLTTDFVNSNGRHDLTQIRSSLRDSGPSLRRRAVECAAFPMFYAVLVF